MTRGLTCIGLSVAWAAFLLLRVKSILGTKFLILSGDNILNAKGIQLSEGALLGLWALAIGGAFFGIYLIYQEMQNSGSPLGAQKASSEPTKICPKCAETIKLAAKVCKHCGHEFEAATVSQHQYPAMFRHLGREIRHNNKTYIVDGNEFSSSDEAKNYVESIYGGRT